MNEENYLLNRGNSIQKEKEKNSNEITGNQIFNLNNYYRKF